jgi:hypothetical protein
MVRRAALSAFTRVFDALSLRVSNHEAPVLKHLGLHPSRRPLPLRDSGLLRMRV